MSSDVVKPRVPAWFLGTALVVAVLLLWWSHVSTPARAPDPATSQGQPEPTREAGSPVAEGQVAMQREPVVPSTVASTDAHASGIGSRDIEVIVRDEREQPVPGASLVLSRDGEEWLSESEQPASVAGTTDGAGRATLHAAEQDLRFVAAVKVPVGASAFRGVSDKGRVELSLATCDAEVRGRVVDHRGGGVAGVHVLLSEERGTECWFVVHRPVPRPLAVRRRVTTASDGSFVIRVSRTWKSLLVDVQQDRLRFVPRFIDPGDELVLELPGRAVVRGVVLDWRGEPVPGCEVWAGEPHMQFTFEGTGSVVTADAEGRFEVPFREGGRYVVVPLGNATTPAGAPVSVALTEAAPVHVEVRTAEPANLEGEVVGSRKRPIRIVAYPQADEDGRTREVTRTGDGEFVLRGLMRGVEYWVIAYEDGVEIGRGRREAGDGGRTVLSSKNWGTCVLSCRVQGDGLPEIAGKDVRIAVHAINPRNAKGARLEKAVTAVDWRGEIEVRFDDLPPLLAAVPVLTVDGVEVARSEPCRLDGSPLATVIDVPRSGAIDLVPAHSKEDWCAQVRRADGSEMLGRELTWQDAGAPFRCTLPAGEYVLLVGYEGDRKLGEAEITVVAGKTKLLRMP